MMMDIGTTIILPIMTIFLIPVAILFICSPKAPPSKEKDAGKKGGGAGVKPTGHSTLAPASGMKTQPTDGILSNAKTSTVTNSGEKGEKQKETAAAATLARTPNPKTDRNEDDGEYDNVTQNEDLIVMVRTPGGGYSKKEAIPI